MENRLNIPEMKTSLFYSYREVMKLQDRIVSDCPFSSSIIHIMLIFQPVDIRCWVLEKFKKETIKLVEYRIISDTCLMFLVLKNISQCRQDNTES